MPTRRLRISENSPDAASTAPSATVLLGLDLFESVMIVATLQGATGGALDVYLQVRTKNQDSQPDEWVDYAHFAQIAAAAGATTKLWSVTRAAQVTTAATVGKNASPALAANTILGGEFGSEMRALFVAGSGTSAGAAQIIDVIGTLPRAG
jgi:hypothetical protein